jgi:hypothetical protein
MVGTGEVGYGRRFIGDLGVDATAGMTKTALQAGDKG